MPHPIKQLLIASVFLSVFLCLLAKPARAQTVLAYNVVGYQYNIQYEFTANDQQIVLAWSNGYIFSPSEYICVPTGYNLGTPDYFNFEWLQNLGTEYVVNGSTAPPNGGPIYITIGCTGYGSFAASPPSSITGTYVSNAPANGSTQTPAPSNVNGNEAEGCMMTGFTSLATGNDFSYLQAGQTTGTSYTEFCGEQWYIDTTASSFARFTAAQCVNFNVYHADQQNYYESFFPNTSGYTLINGASSIPLPNANAALCWPSYVGGESGAQVNYQVAINYATGAQTFESPGGTTQAKATCWDYSVGQSGGNNVPYWLTGPNGASACDIP
jgi:hypothetical protein